MLVPIAFSDGEKVTESKKGEIARAYALALDMIHKTIDVTKLGTANRLNLCNRDSSDTVTKITAAYTNCFGPNPNYMAILATLQLTKGGLLDVQWSANRIYLYSSESKPDKDGSNTTKVGYVSAHPLTHKARSYLPKVGVHLDAQGNQTQAGVKNLRKIGHIHVNVNVNSLDTKRTEMDVAATIIHEATHRYAGTGDFAYEDEKVKWANMSAVERLNNADSYAMLCKWIYLAD
jgi:hypothetical protein